MKPKKKDLSPNYLHFDQLVWSLLEFGARRRLRENGNFSLIIRNLR